METGQNIRNFVIIAHIDSGKSTLADRLLEITGTVPMRSMRAQYLDRLPLERERGITIKMAPVRMEYVVGGKEDDDNDDDNDDGKRLSHGDGHRHRVSHHDGHGQSYILNLIDTPGHSDFSYEVSRALIAVEGAILLVDGTKGIQAQTLSNLRAAQKAGLTIIPAVNKIDLLKDNDHDDDNDRIRKMIQSVADLLGVPTGDIFRISAKTGAGVKELLDEVIKKVPAPRHHDDHDDDHDHDDDNDTGKRFSHGHSDSHGHRHSHSGLSRALIFDSLYDDHKGIIANVRVFEGEFSATEDMKLIASGAGFKPKEVGFFSPDLVVSKKIATGEIGYIATGLKEPSLVKIGDTIIADNGYSLLDNGKSITNNQSPISSFALPGYKEVGPVVFISFYPDGGTKFDDLKRAFERLRLNDAALSFEPDSNEALGRGLKVGFLGQLHFEITSSRLVSEYSLEFLTTFPSIAYRVRDKGVERIIKQPQDFPDKPEKVWEPLVALDILAPQSYLSSVLSLQTVFDIEIAEIKNIGDNLLIEAKMPLRELIRDFDDRLKSASQGYASFTYELQGERETEVEKLEILVVDDVVPALTRIVPKKDLEREGRQTAERLKELLPQEQFSQAIQARSQGRIIARETIPAMKKELGNFGKNGGDRTRKMKLWKKQERGKERLQAGARVEISPEVFREILKK